MLKRKIFVAGLILLVPLIITACDYHIPIDRLLKAVGFSSGYLFQDDYSDQSSGWKIANEKNRVMGYDSEGFRIYVRQPYLDVWSTPGLTFKDVIVEVDAKMMSGPEDNHFGVICRYKEKENSFYAFLITSDGYYGIGKMIDDNFQLIGNQSMQISTAIIEGLASNHITASCSGNKLSLSVNGIHLLSVEDDAFMKGEVGLIAGTYGTIGTDILFDNFIVEMP